ncbi:hypothetical protein KFL_000710300 [Klebsormidium nitens]|uniref:Fungal lipase-type domain-containing protein n=1 Tax=Klebsormidium nitens TaxID=105231 RepID=A0A1Y1HR60_KLENI|nr:hypothetical protein KFL_000710300 [Klebsormidium nitens]|eukprot:GAQ81125.1 hypothetical protein KFL_000710300 [Klebsormidium nitens]
MAEHPGLYGSPSRPYSMRASLIIPDDASDDLDPSTVRSDVFSAAWHTVQKQWRHHRHSILVGVILVVCFALVMCFFTTQGAVVAQSRAPQKTWRTISHLMIVNTTEFQAFVGPLAEMTMNAQTWPRAQPIAGWQLAGDPLGFVGSVKGGMHALTYVDVDFNNTRQVVIAFRGVNPADTLDGLADRCADFLLWYGGYENAKSSDFIDFAFECQEKFNYRTLGYYSQAIDHTRSVLAAYPGASILLTGHGMGAGLALLVSASNLSPETGPMPVIAFSAPSVGHALQARNLKMWKAESSLAYIIGDRWDREMSMTDDVMKGHVCAYETPRPDSCATCQAQQAAAAEHRHRRLLEHSKGIVTEPSVSPECKECSERTHDLSHVIALLTTQQRPYCT